MRVLEIGRRDQRPLTPALLTEVGKRVSSMPNVVGVWTAVEDQGTPRRVERLQVAIATNSGKDAASTALSMLSDIASRHRIALEVALFFEPAAHEIAPDVVPKSIAKILGLQITVNTFVTVGEVFLPPAVRDARDPAAP